MYARHLTHGLLEALSDSPVVFLNGARQTGKSTLAQQLAAGPHPARYVTLDDIGVLSAAKSDPQGFLAGFDGPVILDEVQRAPELFLPLKAEVDRDRRAGRFLLTGSASALVLPRLSESLTGRMEILTLWPLSQGELDGVKEGFIDALFTPGVSVQPVEPIAREELWQRVARGGYPEPLSRPRPERRRAWVSSYLTAILERDVRDLANIEGLTQLPRLMNLLAIRTASLMNFAEISRAMGFPQTTLKRYLALLEATFLARRLPPWSGNLSKRLVKAPKLYLNDTGLAADLLGIEAARIGTDGALSGPLLETFAMAELEKQLGWSRTRPRMYHFRTQTGLEVDIVLEDGQGRCVGIEIKAGSVAAGDFKGLKALEETLGKRFIRGIVLHAGRETVPFAKNMHALPVSALWLLRGKR
ncbi:MAG: ATP-binding protein [Elusimicrobiota bacterium]